MDDRFAKRLEDLRLVPDTDTAKVRTPGMPALKAYWSLMHGLCADGVDGRPDRWYTAADLVVPEWGTHLIAISDQTARERVRTDHFSVVSVRVCHGSNRMPETVTNWSRARGGRGYRPDRAEAALRNGRQLDPWICFSTSPKGMERPHRNQLDPLMHCPDLRRKVDRPSRNLVVIDGETYVNIWHLRIWAGCYSKQAIRDRICRQLAQKNVGPIWARLNSKPMHDRRVNRRFGPYQIGEPSGRINNLKRLKTGDDGFVQATGTFEPVENLPVTFGRVDDLDRAVEEDMRRLSVVVPVRGVPTTMTMCDELKLSSEEVTVKFCPQSLHGFLLYCVQRHASAPAKWPGGLYNKTLELVHALDPDAFAGPVDRFRETALRTQLSVLQILPRHVPVNWALSFQDIASLHGISVSTVKRRVKEFNINVLRARPPRILRREYDRRRAEFRCRTTTSA